MFYRENIIIANNGAVVARVSDALGKRDEIHMKKRQMAARRRQWYGTQSRNRNVFVEHFGKWQCYRTSASVFDCVQ